MINFQVDAAGIDALRKSLWNVEQKLSKELGIIVHKTGNQAKIKIARMIATKVKVDIKAVKKNIIVKRSNAHTAEVVIGGGKRIGLKYFDARQTLEGVSYSIEHGKERGFVRGAFMGPRPGMLAPKLHGHAFIRAGYQEPVPREPHEKARRRSGPVQRTKTGKPKIIKLFGPSILAVFLKNNMLPELLPKIHEDLRKQLNRRINYNNLKKDGVI